MRQPLFLFDFKPAIILPTRNHPLHFIKKTLLLNQVI